MRQKAVLLYLFVLLVFALRVGLTSASNISANKFVTSRLVLEKTSNITTTSWPGAAACTHGQIWLLSPTQIRLVSKNFDWHPSSPDKQTSGHLLIPDYGNHQQKITIGPYPAGTEVKLGIKPGSFCKGFFTSEDLMHTKFRHNGGGSWTIAWEDRTDFDYNDVYTEVTLTPIQTGIVDEVIAVEAFSSDPIYKLPWPNKVGHKLTSYPGYSGEHRNIDAYDFAMKSGDLLVASEKGLVLWIEDSFGRGSCDPDLRSSANVVVIQTEEGINQIYVHLKQGTVSEFGLKVGDVVAQGQPIGRAGSSGYSCSSSGGGAGHLHIEGENHRQNPC